MEDRFKFRGKDIGGEWAYGNLSVLKNDIRHRNNKIEKGFYISNRGGMPFAFHIRPETVGQCTGRTGFDEETNKEKLLYEGDIATITSIEYRETHPDLPDSKIEWNYFGVVRYSKEFCSFYLDTKEHGDIPFGKDDEIMIHGNEFDNPELLEGE